MNAAVTELNLSTSSWWAAHRLRYNAILLLGAAVSLVSLLAVWWLFESRLPCLEITGFSFLVSGFFFLVSLALANLCYFLGPLAEGLLHPKDIQGFRHRALALGTGFSLVLIFLPVVGNLVAAAFDQTVGGNCG
jgi:hypothetical protein